MPEPKRAAVEMESEGAEFLSSVPQPKRFCIQYRETPAGEKPKPKVFHNFFNAIDENDATKQFWKSPTWNGATKKVEILEVRKSEID